MDKAWVGIYLGFSLMIIALILQVIATSLTAALDKYSTIPASYRNLMFSSVVIFFTGLIIVMLMMLWVRQIDK